MKSVLFRFSVTVTKTPKEGRIQTMTILTDAAVRNFTDWLQRFLLMFVLRQIKSLRNQHEWTNEHLDLMTLTCEEPITVRTYYLNDKTPMYIRRMTVKVYYDDYTHPIGQFLLESKTGKETAVYGNWVILWFRYLRFPDAMGTDFAGEATIQPRKTRQLILDYETAGQ